MQQITRLFTATIKMLVRDKAAFAMAVAFPVMFVLAFSIFDVGISAEGAEAEVDYFDYVLPGLLAIGLMNFAMVGSAAGVARFRELKILKRIVATPLRPWKFVSGQVGARLVLAAVQTAIIMAVGVLLGGDLGSGWAWLLVISLMGNLIFISLGFAIAGRVSSVEAANNAAGLATTPLMFLSGSFFPVESMPGWLQPIADVLPLTPLVDALRAIAIEGAGIMDVGGELAIIGAWIVGGLLLARSTFRFNAA